VLEVEQQASVTVVRLKHGKVNALDLELLQAITAALHDIAPNDPVVITGSGSVFSAGVDLRRIADGGRPYVAQYLPALSAAFLAIFDHPGPVVAAVDGHAIAGGCVIAAACDLRLMSSGTIGLAELSVGVPFPPVALEIMRHAVGPAVSRLVLTAGLLDPARAHAIGLIHEVIEPDDLLAEAVRQTARMARVPAEVFEFSKRQLQQPARARFDGSEGDDEAVLAMWSSDRTRAAIAGYLDSLKRPR
jgi:enoyl-CoA hydratase